MLSKKDINKIIKILIKKNKLIFLAFMFVTFLVAAISIVFPLLVKQMLDKYLPNKDYNNLILFSICSLLVVILRTILIKLQYLLSSFFSLNIEKEVRNNILSSIYSSKKEIYKIELLHQTTIYDLENLASYFVRFFDDFGISIITLLSISIILIITNYILGTVFVILLVINFVMIKIITKKIKHQNIKIRRTMGDLSGLLQNHIEIVEPAKKMGFVKMIHKQANEKNEKNFKEKISLASKISTFRSMSNLTSYAINIIPIILGIFLVSLGSSWLMLSDLFLFIMFIGYSNTPIYKLINFLEQKQKYLSFISNINLSKYNEHKNISKNTELFKHIIIKEHESNFEWKVSKNKSFLIKGGSGTGKTQLLNKICDLKNYQKNYHINFNKGYKINDKDLFILFQDPLFFKGTIAQNVALDNDFDVKRMRWSLKMAEILFKVNNLEKKWMSKINIHFSRGEKQRIHLARLFYHSNRKKIFLLDEPFTALDNTTFEKVLKNFEKVFKTKTCLVVSHRELENSLFWNGIITIK